MGMIVDPYLGAVRDDRVTLAALAAVGVRPTVVAKYDAPYLLAPSGTFTDASGAFTLGTALAVVPNGVTPGGGNCWIYLPAGSGGLTAGWREAVFASTTAGYLIGLPTTTATAWTGATGIIALPGLTIPGGALGPNGHVETLLMTRNSATAGTKTIRTGVGGSSSGLSLLQTTAAAGSRSTPIVVNRGVTNRQVCGVDSGLIGSGSVAPYATINTDLPWSITPSLQCAVATDWIMLDYAAAMCIYVA